MKEEVRRVRNVPAVVQEVAEQLRDQTTPAEAVLWQALRGRKCSGLKFRRQHAVGTFILDFYCAEAKLVVEVDGGIHDLPDIKAHDELRAEQLQWHGCHVLRVTNEAVLHDLPAVLTAIEQTAASRLDAQQFTITDTAPLAPPLPALGEGVGG